MRAAPRTDGQRAILAASHRSHVPICLMCVQLVRQLILDCQVRVLTHCPLAHAIPYRRCLLAPLYLRLCRCPPSGPSPPHVPLHPPAPSGACLLPVAAMVIVNYMVLTKIFAGATRWLCHRLCCHWQFQIRVPGSASGCVAHLTPTHPHPPLANFDLWSG